MDLFKTLRLPEDVAQNSSIITIKGNNSIMIENFKTIMTYKNDLMKIKAKDKIISIFGSNLSVEYYNSDEIKVSGKFEQIQFEVLCD